VSGFATGSGEGALSVSGMGLGGLGSGSAASAGGFAGASVGWPFGEPLQTASAWPSDSGVSHAAGATAEGSDSVPRGSGAGGNADRSEIVSEAGPLPPLVRRSMAARDCGLEGTPATSSA